MKITKFVHSCVLVDVGERVALFDPGSYSWQSKVFNIDKIEKITDVGITHIHPDHLDLDFLKVVTDKFPKAEIVTTKEVKEHLEGSGVTNRLKVTCRTVVPFTVAHENVEPIGLKTPQNKGFHFAGEFTHPGDSHSFDSTKRVLAMPFLGPWGNLMKAVELVIKLKPEKVISIHDWHYNDSSRAWLYERLEDVLPKQGIEFVRLEDGKTVEI